MRGIDAAARKVTVCDLATGRVFEDHYDKLVLATGSSNRVPQVPGSDRVGVQTLKTVAIVIALLSITALTPVLGGFFGFLIPLAVVLFILIILHPYAPKVLNNVGFAYLTVACIDTTALATHLPQFFITFIVGSVIFNGVCVLLMKPAKALAVKSVQKENA